MGILGVEPGSPSSHGRWIVSVIFRGLGFKDAKSSVELGLGIQNTRNLHCIRDDPDLYLNTPDLQSQIGGIVVFDVPDLHPSDPDL